MLMNIGFSYNRTTNSLLFSFLFLSFLFSFFFSFFFYYLLRHEFTDNDDVTMRLIIIGYGYTWKRQDSMIFWNFEETNFHRAAVNLSNIETDNSWRKYKKDLCSSMKIISTTFIVLDRIISIIWIIVIIISIYSNEIFISSNLIFLFPFFISFQIHISKDSYFLLINRYESNIIKKRLKGTIKMIANALKYINEKI